MADRKRKRSSAQSDFTASLVEVKGGIQLPDFSLSPILPHPAAKMDSIEKVPQPVAQLPDMLFWSISWFHLVILTEEVDAAISANLKELGYGE